MNGIFGQMNFETVVAETFSSVANHASKPDFAGPRWDTADAVVFADAALVNEQSVTCERRGFRGPADTIADAWVEHGLDAPQVLLGDYVFAVLDRRQRRIVLVRDAIGTRSLYWRQNGSALTISTDLHDIAGSVASSPPIDARVVALHLAAPGRPLPKTFFTEIFSVPPGSLVVIDASGVQIRRWWDPPGNPVRLARPTDYVTTMRGLLEQAVGDCIHGASAVGAHISGGIDSTGVGVLAARALAQRGERLKGAYTWSPSISEFYPAKSPHDERQRVIAAAGEVPIRFGSADEHNFLAFLERPLEFEGTADLADEIPMLELAARDGVDIMLSGWGGDEAFSAHGYGYPAHLLTTLKPQRLAHFMRSQLRSLRQLKPVAELLWRQAILPLLPDRLNDRFSPYPDTAPRSSFISEDLRRQYRDEIAERRQPLRFGRDVTTNIKRHLFNGHIGMRMETWDAWARPYGFRYRYPLVDRRILEFALAIPTEMLFLGERPRGLALAALGDALPPNINKYDIANEQLREASRAKAWRLIADRTQRGTLLQGGCPWLDMRALRACALQPLPQNTGPGVVAFAELFSALRIWHLYRRHHPH